MKLFYEPKSNTAIIRASLAQVIVCYNATGEIFASYIYLDDGKALVNTGTADGVPDFIESIKDSLKLVSEHNNQAGGVNKVYQKT